MTKKYGVIFSQSRGCPKVPYIALSMGMTTNGHNCCGKFQAIFPFPIGNFEGFSKIQPQNVTIYGDIVIVLSNIHISSYFQHVARDGLLIMVSTYGIMTIYIYYHFQCHHVLSNGFLWSHLAKRQNRNYFSRIVIMIFNFGHVLFTKSMFSP